jgi:4-hydroxybenzoate polyprenyltransferase
MFYIEMIPFVDTYRKVSILYSTHSKSTYHTYYPMMLREIGHFLIHLRLHYHFFLLSGGYLLGGFLAGTMDAANYILQFLNVHILLYGGATAYNSYWDRDTGPIGGLKNPPKMTRWMHPASLLLMFIALLFALPQGLLYSTILLISLITFWLYSTPHARWKQHPILSLIAIAVSTGITSVILGTLAAGGSIQTLPVLSATLGATLILLSMYPVSQVFQIAEDQQRGDQTFAVRYGITGVRRFFSISFLFGLMGIIYGVSTIQPAAGLLLLAGTLLSYAILLRILTRLRGEPSEYPLVMRAKFIASLSFVLFFLAGNLILYAM